MTVGLLLEREHGYFIDIIQQKEKRFMITFLSSEGAEIVKFTEE
jgi:hypothetical protein